uniref:Uncharacterized protein n=1 Tax=Panagrolaimus superbus TaxID=310955 RepID=A0A914YSG0_9BILA
MKQCLLFFILFVIINFVGSDELNVYHGNRRYWTVAANNKTHIALHILKEPIKLVFPKEKTIVDLLSGLKLYSPTGNGKCDDTTHELNFTLTIADLNCIRGQTSTEDFNNVRTVTTNLYETCGGTC